MVSEGRQQKVVAEKVVVVSNVRSELPDIEGLKSSILARGGILVPLIGYNVGENVSVLKAEIPKQRKRVEGCAETLESIDPVDTPAEFEDAELELERHKNLLRIMEEDLKALKDLPDDYVRVIDGHRRFSAGIQAGIGEFNFMIHSPDPDPTQIIMDQLATGLESQEITALDEGRAYRRLLGMGYKQGYISANIGKKASRAHILQRTKLLELFERAEKIDTETTRNFCRAMETGEILVQVMNKLAQYYDREDISNSNMEEMFSWALDENLTGNEFVKKVNDKFGRRKGVSTPTTSEGESEGQGASDEGQGSGDKDEGDSDPKARKRPEKELRFQRDKWGTMLDLAETDLKEKGKKSKVSQEDVDMMRGVVLGLGFAMGETQPPVPTSMEKIAEKIDEEQEKKKAAEAAESQKAKDAQRAVKKEERKKLNAERAAVRQQIRDFEKTVCNPLAKRHETYDRQLSEIDVKLKAEDLNVSDREDLERKAQIATQAKAGITRKLHEAQVELQAMKPDWYLEEEERREERKKKAAEKKSKEESEGKDSSAE